MDIPNCHELNCVSNNLVPLIAEPRVNAILTKMFEKFDCMGGKIKFPANIAYNQVLTNEYEKFATIGIFSCHREILIAMHRYFRLAIIFGLSGRGRLC